MDRIIFSFLAFWVVVWIAFAEWITPGIAGHF